MFKRSWLYVAHESEIPNPGDYVTRTMARDPVIVVRTSEGRPKVLLNSCAHRGTQICRSDFGNTSHFRCMYHGWTYDTVGNLRGVPGLREYYPPRFKREDHPLRAAQTETFRGLIFASWSEDALSLQEYLGDVAFYLEALVSRTTLGVEVLGPPLQWIAKTNWKVATENFAHDSLHLATLHASGVRLNQTSRREESRAFTVDCGSGHSVEAQKMASERDFPGYGEDWWAEFRRNLSPAQLWWMKGNRVFKGNVFPNFSFIEAVHDYTGDPSAPSTAGTMLRKAEPIAVDRSLISMWILVPVGASDEFGRRAQESLVRTLGVSGSFEPEDLENGACVRRGSMGGIGLDENFLYPAGEHLETVNAELGHDLPGDVFECSLNTEIMQRGFYAHWLRLMGEAVGYPAATPRAE